MNTDVNLGFSTGVQNVSINGKCTVHVNFTDSAFIERVFNAFDVLDGLEDKYRPLIENAQSGKEVLFIDNMDSTLANEKKQTNPRLKKYVEKYQKYQKKQ